MRVLIVGSGGREHTLAWKLVQSPEVKEIFVVPGNGGTASGYGVVPREIQGLKELANWAEIEGIDLTVVGPEGPLVEGITDLFQEKRLKVFGPTAAGAALEGSKVFAKEMMVNYGIPTGDYQVCSRPEEALSYLEKVKTPVVVKADGLAAGKGVFVARTLQEAQEAVKRMMVDRVFGAAGDRILLEEFLEGEEASILAITDGEQILTLAPSQDHKRIFDGDGGDNTGGMGAFSPTPLFHEDLTLQVEEEILTPILKALKNNGISYQGVLYAGLMITPTGPRVLEFNCRFGDPETQVLLPRIKGDLFPILYEVAEGQLKSSSVQWDPRVALCVVMASGGYPHHYHTGYPIHGLDTLPLRDDLLVFQAGTLLAEGRLQTAGGRVLGVTALDDDYLAAKKKAYQAVETITFTDSYFRRDIGDKAIFHRGR